MAWRMPSSSRPWLPQSASECTASAIMAPEPVTKAANSLATKMAKLAPSASRMALMGLAAWPDMFDSFGDGR